jgi:hypothetical protein
LLGGRRRTAITIAAPPALATVLVVGLRGRRRGGRCRRLRLLNGGRSRWWGRGRLGLLLSGRFTVAVPVPFAALAAFATVIVVSPCCRRRGGRCRRLSLLYRGRGRRRGRLGLLGGRFNVVVVSVTLTASAAFATVIVLALGLGRLSLLRLRLGFLRGWRGATPTAAGFAIALFAALAAFFVVVWGGRFCPRGLCNLEGFTWKRLPVGHRREGDSTEGGE